MREARNHYLGATICLFLAAAVPAGIATIAYFGVEWCRAGSATDRCGEVAPLLGIGLALVATMAAMAAGLLFTRDELDAAESSWRDARKNRVRRFVGSIPFYSLGDPFLVGLVGHGLLAADDREQAIEVLDSDRLWTINQRRLGYRVKAPLWDAPASGPETAQAAARVRPAPDQPDIHTSSRELTTEEKAELQKLARALEARGSNENLGWVFVCSMWTVGAIGMEGPTAGMMAYKFIAALVGFGLLLFRVRRWWLMSQFASSLDKDATAGTVTVVRPQKPLGPIGLDDPRLAETLGHMGPQLLPGIERLSVSKTAWTLDGRPARWRSGA
jgi:hypothetical protein